MSNTARILGAAWFAVCGVASLLYWAAGPLIPHRQGAEQDPGAAWRAKAHEEAQLRSKSFEDSQLAYKMGNGKLAKELSEKGKQHGRNMDAHNARAADEIFAFYNPAHPSLTGAGSGWGRAPPVDALAELDLHGLYVIEAIAACETHVALCRRAGVPRTVLITGRGNRSAGGLARIKPAVEGFLKRENLRAWPDMPNAGCVTVELDVPKEKAGWADSCLIM